MTELELRAAFAAAGLTAKSAGCIRVRHRRSGKEYHLHADQLTMLDGDRAALWAYPVKPPLRQRPHRGVFMLPANMEVAE